MRIADVTAFRSRTDGSVHSFVTVESTFTAKPGILGVLHLIETSEEGGFFEMLLLDRKGADALIDEHKEDWNEIEGRRPTISPDVERVIQGLSAEAFPTAPRRDLLDAAQRSLRPEERR